MSQYYDKMKAKVRIHCKFCDDIFIDADSYANHLERTHRDSLPPDMTGWQYYYFQKTGKDRGSCVICKKPTDWNEKTHKYKRFCNNPACKKAYVDTFRKRMIGKYGKVNLLDDPDQQRKMLANRSISGVYRWSKDPQYKFSYTGSYELEFLKFLDLDMDFDPTDIMAPSPHTYHYVYDGKTHFYIPDFFIPSLSLEIEIKDGGDNPNMHHKIQDVDKEKEKLKDLVMKSNQSTFNYLKIENKDHMRFLIYLQIAKDKFQNGEVEKIYMA